MRGHWSRLAPLSGLVFAGLFLAAIVGTASSPNSDASAQRVISFFDSNRTNQLAFVFLIGYSVIFGLIFGAALRSHLRARSGSDLLPSLGFAGMIVFGVFAAMAGVLTFAAVDVPTKIQPAAEQALNVLGNDIFPALFIGMSVFLFANGLAIARTRALPRWVGWIGIVLGILAVVPAPTLMVAFFGVLAWVAVVSVLMFISEGRPSPAPAATPA